MIPFPDIFLLDPHPPVLPSMEVRFDAIWRAAGDGPDAMSWRVLAGTGGLAAEIALSVV